MLKRAALLAAVCCFLVGAASAFDLKTWVEIFTGPSAPPGFFVATNGNDNNPGTITAPFATFAKALTAMEGSSKKITYVRKGTYLITATITMTSADNGETFSYYPPDGYNSAIIDGTNLPALAAYTAPVVGDSNGNLPNAWLLLINGGNNITINGLQFQNAPGGNAVHGGNADSGWGSGPNGPITSTTGAAHNNVIKNNILHHFTYVQSDTADPYPNFITPILMHGDVQNEKILHNVVYDAQTQGITAGVGNGPNSGADNLVIDSHVVLKTDQSPGDSGAICFEDRNVSQGPAGSTGIIIHNNFVRDAAGHQTTDFDRCFYFDDYSSNISATQNVCTGLFNVPFQWHGSNNIVVTGNIIDYVPTSYWTVVIANFDPLPLLPMTGNVFTGNRDSRPDRTPTAVGCGKGAIAAESLAPDAVVSDVARRHGVTRWQVYDWRRRFRIGRTSMSEEIVSTPAFVRLAVDDGSQTGRTTDVIEIAIGDVVIRAGRDVWAGYSARFVRRHDWRRWTVANLPGHKALFPEGARRAVRDCARDVWAESVQRRRLRVQVKASGPDQGSGLGSNRARAGAQAT